MENIFESLKSLEISENCFQEILEMIEKEVQSQAALNSLPGRRKKVEQLLGVIERTKGGKEIGKAIKDLGVAQKRVVNAEKKAIKSEPQNQGVTFTSKFFN